ncbi:hypothetical protein ACQY0O_003319 [Thecaphora frezii]|nr:GTP-binding protein Rab5c-like protein [Thecaphora frezii]
MAAQVHAGSSALHSFPSSSFSSAKNSPVATPSSEREMTFDNLSGISASGLFDVKGQGSGSSTSARQQTISPKTTRTEPIEAASRATRQNKLDKTNVGQSPEQAQSGARTHRPRLKSLQSLNAAPASPTLSESNSGNAQLPSTPATFSRPRLPAGGGALESLQPLAAAGVASSGSFAQRSESSTSISRAGKGSATKMAKFAEAPTQFNSGSLSPRSGAASHVLHRDNGGYTEFGAIGSGSTTRTSLDNEASLAARTRTQSAHALAGPGLKRSNTMSAGFESLSSMDAGPSTLRPGNSSTFGFGSSAVGRARHGPGLGARRQTVSNIHANDFDQTLTSQGRTMAYTQQQQQQQQSHHGSQMSSVFTSPQSHNHLRERTVLQGNQLEAKVVILGTQGVGKTSLVHRYTSGQFSASSIPSTIGASFLTKKLIVDGVKVRLQLWDTAGQERFRSMAPMYYRGSNAAVIVYDITSMQSFMDVKSWIEELRKNMSYDLVIHVVGAKLDLAYSKRSVDLDFARFTVRSWVRPTVTPPESPDLSHPISPSKSTSRLGGLGNLAIGSASRLASFPRAQSSPQANFGAAGKPGSSGSGASATGSGGSDRGLDCFSDGGGLCSSPESCTFPSWEQIEVSEVSAKDDEGIEDVFLSITKKLVERKAVIEQERLARERNSIILSESSWDNAGGPNARGGGAPGETAWTCCT